MGASGILAPLVVDLAAAANGVMGVGRRATALEALAARLPTPGSSSFSAMAVDTTAVLGAELVAAAGPFDRAVVYAPAVTAATFPILLGGVDGRAVLVLTSEAASPARSDDEGADPAAVAARCRPRCGDGVVLLGWRTLADGTTAWHSPAEVSAACAAALDGTDDLVVGQLRPWSGRPVTVPDDPGARKV